MTTACWNIVPADAAHIPHIAAHMRDADRREVWASHRHAPREALEFSLASARTAWTCFVDGQPAFMWGASPRGNPASRVGVPWLLGTPDILKVRREFLRQSRGYVARMAEGFDRLENYVHADNALSVRWLSWCGFTVISAAPVSINGETFYFFRRESNA